MKIREYTEYKEEEILKLYRETGWSAYTDDPRTLSLGFEHSLLVLAAYEGDELMGILRAVGDGFTVVFIQDILVRPGNRRQGVGTALVKELLERYPSVRQIQLTSDSTPDARAFYESLGFRELTEMGCCGFMKCQ